MGAAATAVLVVLRRLLLCVSTGFLSGALAQQASSSADVYCGSLTQDARVVSTADHALTLGADLTACPGLEFNVYWRGTIGLSQPLQLTNATILRIIGESKEESVANGGGEVSLFVASELSVLYLESVGLTGGYGVDGGAVAAVGGSSVTLVDCDVYGNTAGSKGGAVYLEGGSSLNAGGANFTGNSADIYGGAVHAEDASTVTTQDGTTNTFHGNAARLGGAIHTQDSSDVTFGNGVVSLSSNSAQFEGGAIHLERSCTVR
ncbi:unnamed protein product, partial [Ectocarpus sp. 4 AP-2014]